jgi:hypothetical protein
MKRLKLSVLALAGALTLAGCAALKEQFAQAMKPKVIIGGKVYAQPYTYQTVPTGTINLVTVVPSKGRSAADIEREMKNIRAWIQAGKVVAFAGEKPTYYPLDGDTIDWMRQALTAAAGKDENGKIAAVWDAVRKNKETGEWGLQVAKEYVKVNAAL